MERRISQSLRDASLCSAWRSSLVKKTQLIYVKVNRACLLREWWAVMDSNHRRLSQLSYSQPHLATLVTALCFFLSLLSDSNQRPRDYKSRALANWAKEAKSNKPFYELFHLKRLANVRLFFELTKYFKKKLNILLFFLFSLLHLSL